MEWSSDNIFNPFNPMKSMAHLGRYIDISNYIADPFCMFRDKNEPLPMPSMITVDPINACNLKCEHCNSHDLLSLRSHKIGFPIFSNIIDGILESNKRYGHKIRAIWFVGGGEPTLHPQLSDMIEESYDIGLKVGIVTNGVIAEQLLDTLSLIEWIGVSVDAATPETFKAIKGKDYFDRVIENIKTLSSRFRDKNRNRGIHFKFLITPKNLHEIYKAATLAKEIGCTSFHARPAAIPNAMDDSTHTKTMFTQEMLQVMSREVKDIQIDLDTPTFKTYVVTARVKQDFSPNNDFKKCYATFMTFILMPPKFSDHGFSIGLCCDRRGDPRVEFGDFKNYSQFLGFWGSKEHMRLFNDIDPSKCPKCTMRINNKIMEEVVLNDNMGWEFS